MTAPEDGRDISDVLAYQHPPGLIFDVVEAGPAFPFMDDPFVADMFPAMSPYVGKNSLSYALMRSTNTYGRWTRTNELVAPRELLSPQELADVRYEYELEDLLRRRGVAEGAVKVKEYFGIHFADARQRELLGLEEGDRILLVTREFYDEQALGLVYQREVLAVGEATGHVRVLPRENRSTYEW